MNKTCWQYPFNIPTAERPPFWHYLLEQGPLTQRLRRDYPNLNVQPLNQYYTHLSHVDALALQTEPSQRAMVREVYLCNEHEILTYGRCIIPENLFTQPSLITLKNLGSRSLGDVLSRRTQWQRKNLQISLLSSANIEYQQAIMRIETTNPTLWARRSQLIVGEYPILVTEVFLTGLTQNANCIVKNSLKMLMY